jgi:inhibitor of cysteine peptidase
VIAASAAPKDEGTRNMPITAYSRPGALVAVLAALLLTGCGQRQDPPAAAAPRAAPTGAPQPAGEKPRAAPVLTLTDREDGRAVTLQRGQVVEIRFAADRVNGFTWIPTQNALPILSTDGVPLYEIDEEAGPGAPGTEIWRFIGREPGHAHLVFEYRRPFEADAPPQKSLTYHFDVE